jgi:hypothetical protein
MDPEVNKAMVMDTTQPKMKMKMKTSRRLPSQASHLLIISLPSFIMHVYLLLNKSVY